jgi:hypothetical protein
MVDREELESGNMYHIRVEGNLDGKWADWFDGFVMAPGGSGETLLTGVVADQSALQGVLSKIHSLGLPLLLVAQTGCPCPARNCPRHGQCLECAAHYGDNGKQPFCFRAKTRWDKRCAEIMKAK